MRMCLAAAHWRRGLARRCRVACNKLRSRSGAAVSLVLSSVMLLSMPGPGTARVASAASVNTSVIDSVLLQQMAANPLQALPIIVEMQPATFPFPAQPDVQLAQRALSLLSLNGRAIGGLALIDAAAGSANAAGISAISLDPQVA